MTTNDPHPASKEAESVKSVNSTRRTEKNDKEGSTRTPSVEDVDMGGKTGLQTFPPKLLEDSSQSDETCAGKVRQHFWQVLLPSRPATAPRESLDDAPVLPLAYVSWLSEITYAWITPVIKLGYQRPLQATDLWKMDEPRQMQVMTNRLQTIYSRRQREAAAFNERLRSGEIKPPLYLKVYWKMAGKSFESQHEAWIKKKERKASLLWALNEHGGWWLHFASISGMFGNVAALMAPLVLKDLIEFSQTKYAARVAGAPEPNIGRGIGDALGLLLLALVGGGGVQFMFYRAQASSILIRGTLINLLYQKSLMLSQKSRTKIGTGRLLSHLSADITRIEVAMLWLQALLSEPVSFVVCTVLLIIQLGYSALPGLAVFALLFPMQAVLLRAKVRVRSKTTKWTDARARLLQELLGQFAIIKYFVFEKAYLERIGNIRRRELKGVFQSSVLNGTNMALSLALPSLAAVASFVCYAGTGHDLNPAKIFSALSLFQLLRQPLLLIPRSLASYADSTVAFQRLEEVFDAEDRSEGHCLDLAMDKALRVNNATFEWLSAKPDDSLKNSKGKTKDIARALDESTSVDVDDGAFRVTNLSLEIGRGQLVALVGRIGSGKSSILSGLIGEMRLRQGSVTFGGIVAYCPQSAFIQNATLRDNVLFGQPWNEARYWRVLEEASLISDCALLPDGDLTEIGEKGINLSGGQKQRVNIARALYFDADIILFDDPLSALDAHVGQAIFDVAMVKALRNKGKAVLLVTHALHILPQTDYIYTIDHGQIVERGSYQELTNRQGAFSALIKEFGRREAQEDEGKDAISIDAKAPELEAGGIGRQVVEPATEKKTAVGVGKEQGRLITQEKRETGMVKRRVYKRYVSAGKGWITLPPLLATAVIAQGALVLTGLWLVYWQEDHFQQSTSFYMAIYTAIGISQCLFSVMMGICVAVVAYFASAGLHHDGVRRIFFAPMSFFHTTPLGRIMGVFGKDVDALDNQLSDALRMTALVVGTVISNTILVAVYFPWFLIAVAIVISGYWYYWVYYRASSREIKRLDSMLRSQVYSHFGETLNGLATIHAYNESKRFKHENEERLDIQNRASFLIAVNARWLSIRLDVLGALINLAVALMAAIGVNSITPGEIGLVLSFCNGLTQNLGLVTRQTAEVENNMNSAERLEYYSSEALPQESAFEKPKASPGADWPRSGQIDFSSVTMSYRPDLPPVLRDLTAHIRGGEKVGVVGRTGAGKSSVMATLFRMVELSAGTIKIDGVDIASLGLSELRSKLAIIPQEPQLFNGSFRSNLDPFSLYDDARLYSCLKRAHLLERTGNESQALASAAPSRFNLETDVSDGGENLSAGERSLLSLARALVKDSKIMVLDECTSSVDLETDAKIQQTILEEFHDKTLLCIAHRLRTILSYNRILVLEEGRIQEMDAPLTLFKQQGAFHAMCIASSITEEDIIKAQNGRDASQRRPFTNPEV